MYSPLGGLLKEQFGTTTPIYNKLFYNSRGQLAETRASSSYTGPTDYDANRGAIINSYSSQCTGLCSGSNMPDNNGNLRQQDIQIPSVSTRSQYYEYDSLNRLKSAREVMAAVEQWKQQFTYDRWGNRLIDTAVTYGLGINNKAFTVNTANNRLGVPAGQTGTMTYDAAGNLTNDTYTGAGNRTYDGENKITSAWGGNNQAQLYSYDATGQRIKRTVLGAETWQVYGIGGELVAEYAANGLPTSPQKEYGYRNGQLLITANGSAGALTNFALNKSATQSSTTWSAPASRAVDGNTDGVWNNNSVTHTDYDFHGWWQVDLGQVQSINAIRVWNRAELPERLTSFYVFVSDAPFTSTDLITTQNQAGVSSYYTAGQGGFPTDLAINRTGRYVRVQLAGTNHLHIAEVQILGITPPVNVAVNKTATQSSTHSSGAVASRAVDGNTSGVFANNSVTHTNGDLNAWWQVDLGQVETIGTIKVWNRVELPERLSNFYVFVSDVPFTSTNLATTQNQAGVSSYYTSSQCGFPTELGIYRTGRYVRVQLAGTNYLSIAEVQIFTGPSTPPVQWLISDHLGTPRMVLDHTGNLNSIKRHDYLPFGEELVAPIGGRSTAQGYAGGDGVRQQFTLKERDVETGLDYSINRYYSSNQGRFTSNDPLLESGDLSEPQSWNRYSYSINNPLKFVDPDGLRWVQRTLSDGSIEFGWCSTDECYNKAIDTNSEDYSGWEPVAFDETEAFEYRCECGAGGDRYGRYRLNPDGTHGYTDVLDGNYHAMSTHWNAQLVIGGLLNGLRSILSGLLTRWFTAQTVTQTTQQATTHGAQQLAERGFSAADIALTKTGQQFLQRDGATVFIKEVTPGKFNIIVEGQRGVITALKSVSEKHMANLAKNYGWYSPVK